jgi:hypothetical protein
VHILHHERGVEIVKYPFLNESGQALMIVKAQCRVGLDPDMRVRLSRVGS